MMDFNKRSQRLAAFSGIVALVLFLFTFYLGGPWAHSRMIQSLLLPLLVTFVYSCVAFWRALLVQKANAESQDQERIRQEYERSDLFEGSDSALKLAAHALESFDRIFLSVFTFLGGLLLLVAVLAMWHSWNQAGATIVNIHRDSLGASGLLFFMAVFCLLAGSYFNGTSRGRGCRFMRPIAAWFLAATAGFTLGIGTMLAEHFGGLNWDLPAAHIILTAVAILAVEMMINMIMEFYRPRSQGEEIRPLYESRLLSLVTEPGGIARNVAYSLDYQFGFEVSETWFYQFLERAVVPITLVLILTLYLLDCVVIIDADEMGIREQFGSPVANLSPGLFLKFPAPIQRIRIFKVQKIKKVNLGFSEKKDKNKAEEPPMPEEMQGDPTGKIVVWSKSHYQSETKYIVATREQKNAAKTDAESTKNAVKHGTLKDVPVNFITTSVSVYYQIDPKHLYDYAYNYSNPDQVLQRIGGQVMTAFLGSHDLIQLLGEYRYKAQQDLTNQIREAVKKMQPPLGISVKYVALMGIHPPVKAAPSYENVIAAAEQRKTKQLKAEKEAVKIRNESQGNAKRIVLDSEAYQFSVVQVAEAEAARFKTQLVGFEHAPSIYKERLFLDMLERRSKNLRKYIIATKGSHNIMILDLKEKLRPDMVQDLDLNAPEN